MIVLAADRVDLPDGDYAGVWSAYRIRILRSVRVAREVEIETASGCRSMGGMPVTVRVSGRIATAEEQ